MNYKIIAAALGTLGLWSGLADAQTLPIRPAYTYPARAAESGAASIQLGSSPVYFVPYIGFAAGHDDNLFQRSDNQRSSALYITSPGFKLDARTAATVFQASYQGQVGRYTSSSDDNYVDHVARASYDVAFNQRTFARVGVDYIRSHDPRGSTDRAIQNSPDKYRLISPNATFAFGTPGAAGRIEVYGSETERRYTNNRATTFLSDRDTTEIGGAFYWRVAPRTYAVVDVRGTDIKYKSSLSPFSSEERRVFGGVVWEATAATTGTVKVGRFVKKFDNTFPDSKKTAWEALVTWAPLSYSKFDFYTGRYPTESSGLGSYILTDASGVIWNHAWSSYLNTEVNLRFQKDEYQGFNRSDDIRSLGLRAGYKFRRWLTVGAEYTYTQRDSNFPNFEYDRNLYLLTATLSM